MTATISRPDAALATEARQIKVAQFTDNYGPQPSGLLVAVQTLEKNLLDARHQALLVAPKSRVPNPCRGKEGYSEIRLPSMWVPGLGNRLAMGHKFEKTVAKVIEARPDVIHVHGLGPVGMLGVWAARRGGIPLLVTWHTDFAAYADHYKVLTPVMNVVYKAWRVYGGDEAMDKPGADAAALRHAEAGRVRAPLFGVAASMLESATLVTTPSPKTKTRCHQLAPDANVRVVPNGVDPIPRRAGAEPVPRGEGITIMYLGRVAPEKGIGLLLDAFEILRQKHADAELIIVGDWHRIPALRKRIKEAALGGGIRLAGELKREDLAPYYEAVDMLVFPSLTDTQSLVLHEAALAGCPIVTVDHELTLVVENGVNGEITRPTPFSLAAGIERVAELRQVPGWTQNAAARGRELAGQWTIESQAQEMLDIYTELAEESI